MGKGAVTELLLLKKLIINIWITPHTKDGGGRRKKIKKKIKSNNVLFQVIKTKNNLRTPQDAVTMLTTKKGEVVPYYVVF